MCADLDSKRPALSVSEESTIGRALPIQLQLTTLGSLHPMSMSLAGTRMESSHPEPLRAKRAKVDTPSPTPTFVDDEDGGDDPAIVIHFQEDQVLHNILQLPGIVPGPGSPNFPQSGPNVAGNAAATAANSGVAFRSWVEVIGRAAGMQVSNQVMMYDGVRREGMWPTNSKPC